MKAKAYRLLLPAALLAGLAALAIETTSAKDKRKPQTWEMIKAARLQPVNDQVKEKIEAALPATATAAPKNERRILVFYRCGGFVHTSIAPGNHALVRLGEKTGAFSADLADDYAVFSTENLARYDAVLFNNTTRLKLPEASMRQALLEFMAAGKGVAGIHGASDNFYEWKEGGEMMGGHFNGHPWTAGERWAFQLDDPEHPVNKAFKGQGFWHKDEIYQYKPDTFAGPAKLRILVSLDMSKDKVVGQLEAKQFARFNEAYPTGKRSVPVSWVHEYGGGRVFYTTLGHNDLTFANPAVLQHLLDGIQFALGDLEADASPSAAVSDTVTPALAPAE